MQVKQVIIFDVNNKDHREDFANLLKTKSLGLCKNRYSLEGMYGDLVSMMTDKMVNYYVNREFHIFSK